MAAGLRLGAHRVVAIAGTAAILLAAGAAAAPAGDRQMSTPDDARPMSKAPAVSGSAPAAQNRCEADPGSSAAAGSGAPGEQRCGAVAAAEHMMLMPATAMQAMLDVMRMAAEQAQETMRRAREPR